MVEEGRSALRLIDKKIYSQMHSVQQSHQGSIKDLSVAKTEAKAFQPNNPLVLLRKIQAEKNYVWYATYDEDVLHDSFLRKISRCVDQCLPWEFVPWRLYDFQPFLVNESMLCLRREVGAETLCKIYLVHIDQVKDIVRFKNHIGDRKALLRQNLIAASDAVLSMEQLRKKYTLTKLHVIEDVPTQSPSKSSAAPDLEPLAAEANLLSSIPDECLSKVDMAPNFNFVVTMEGQKEFEDLEDVENRPVLDLIFHEQTAMGLPVVFATNRD